MIEDFREAVPLAEDFRNDDLRIEEQGEKSQR
jgi:hypothetical protein